MNRKTELTKKFLKQIKEELELDKLPNITFNNEPGAAAAMKSFGQYDPNNKSIIINISGRCMADVWRSLGHECFHYKQDLEGRLKDNSGEDGSEIENEANAYAGKFMRKFGRENSEIFDL